MSERGLIGDRLMKRLERRSARRPRIGLSPSFYARFGMADPWLEGSHRAESVESDGDFVYVSGQPFYQMLRRLGEARQRRQQRLARYGSGISRRRLKAAHRLWPGEKARPRFLSGLLSLSDTDMLLPEPSAPEVEDSPEESAGIRVVRGWSGSPARSVSGQAAWLSRPYSPARVAERPSRQSVSARALSRMTLSTHEANHQPSARTRQVSSSTRQAPVGARQVSSSTRQTPVGARQVSSSTRQVLASARQAPVSPRRARPMERVGNRLQATGTSAAV